MRRTYLLVAVAAAAALVSAPTLSATAATPGRLSILIGRSVDGLCLGSSSTPLPDVLNLTQVAQALQARGLVAVTNVVLSRTPATGPDRCSQGRLYPSYTSLASLDRTYGWQVNSEGYSHVQATSPTFNAEYETCDSLEALTARGFSTARGEFAYPNGVATSAVQSVVNSCPYGFGRYYYSPHQGIQFATPHSVQATNGEAPTLSVDGPKLESVATLTRAMMPPAGAWAQVQIYSLIRAGSYRPAGSPGYSWDCRTGVPHTTSVAEIYCAQDFFAALDAARRAGVSGTTPLAQAKLWGRLP